VLGLSVIVSLLIYMSASVVHLFFNFLKGRGFFFKTIFLRRLCKLFDKSLVGGLACVALTMCLKNAWFNIVRKYSFLLQDIDSLNVHILNSL